jgi:integrase
MATIRMREHLDGSFTYQAVIRIKEQGKVVYRESKTFARHQSALTWAKQREVELQDPAVLAQAQAGKKTLASLIRWYIDAFQKLSQWQRTKQNTLEFLERHKIGKQDAYTLSARRLIQHVRSRRNEGTGPATVSIDLTFIKVVLETAKAVGQFPVNPQVVEEARSACQRLGLIGPANKREVRPTSEQLAALDRHFRTRSYRAKIPMADIMWFAVYSARREDEICRLLWIDNDPKTRTGLVRDLKHPRTKMGNHRRFRYTQQAWDIVQRQPRTADRIFPYKAASLKEAFRNACISLGIDDLHFHDLRHEATSRLFERGYEIHEAAQFTLHSSWRDLKRYTHLKPERESELPAEHATNPNVDLPEDRNRLASPAASDAGDQSTPPDQPRLRAKVTSGPRA